MYFSFEYMNPYIKIQSHKVWLKHRQNVSYVFPKRQVQSIGFSTLYQIPFMQREERDRWSHPERVYTESESWLLKGGPVLSPVGLSRSSNLGFGVVPEAFGWPWDTASRPSLTWSQLEMLLTGREWPSVRDQTSQYHLQRPHRSLMNCFFLSVGRKHWCGSCTRVQSHNLAILSEYVTKSQLLTCISNTALVYELLHSKHTASTNFTSLAH